MLMIPIGAALVASIGLTGAAGAHDKPDKPAGAPKDITRQTLPDGSAGDDAAAERYFTNTELIDQNGRAHRFYADLLRGKKVLINFAFTSCSGACPTMTSNLARAQKLLDEKTRKELTFITISVDPVNDTPAALKAFATKLKVGPSWYFLTGTPANVEAVLRRLGGHTSKPSEHLSTLLVGSLSTGHWLKSTATEQPERIAYLARHIDDAR
jgi:protein SCO1/2